MNPIDTLYWYDGPILFTANFLDSQRLVTVVDMDQNLTVYVAASPDQSVIDEVKNNTIPLFDAFQHGPFFRIWEKYPQTIIQEVPCLDPKELADPGVYLSLD